MNDRTKTVPPPQIPLAFVGMALVTLGVTLAWSIVGIAQPLALLHALVVGVFLTVAMGLLYQFVPVVSMSPLRFAGLAYLHMALAAAGTVLLVAGFERVDFGMVRTGGAFHAAGVVLEVIVLFSTVRRGKPPAAALGAASSLLWLVATIALGIWMGDRLARGFTVTTALGLHGVLGLAGFFGTLITAVTFRLLRMFERIDHEPRTGLFAGAASVAAALTALFGRAGGYALVALAVVLGVDALTIARTRNPAYQRETLLYGIASAAGACGAAWCYATGNAATSVVLAVWFYIGTAVTGYLQRIVPFIWWIQRARREGAKAIPSLREMNASPLGYAILVLWLSAGIAWLVWPQTPVAPVIALLAWGLLVVQLLRPFVVAKRAEPV